MRRLGSRRAPHIPQCPWQWAPSLPLFALQTSGRVGAQGLPAVFLEVCVVPHERSWDISLLLEPSQMALGKASPLPWESPARRNPCSAWPAPHFPWALVFWCVPDAVGPSRVQGQWCGEVARGLHSACCLLPGSPCLLSYSLCPHSSREPSPKPSKGILHSSWVREGLPQSWGWPHHLPGTNLSLWFLAVAPNELSQGSPKTCRQSWDEDFTTWGHRQALGVMLGPCAGFSSLPWP